MGVQTSLSPANFSSTFRKNPSGFQASWDYLCLGADTHLDICETLFGEASSWHPNQKPENHPFSNMLLDLLVLSPLSPCCFTLSYKLPQWELNIPSQCHQQDHTFRQKQRWQPDTTKKKPPPSNLFYAENLFPPKLYLSSSIWTICSKIYSSLFRDFVGLCPILYFLQTEFICSIVVLACEQPFIMSMLILGDTDGFPLLCRDHIVQLLWS